ncbi:MAG TPA: DUF4320 family protein [Bacillota bacterium]|jgi:hypothetical protein|nr:DUF4320 family protein [Bacillota bacterium]
MSKSVSLIMNKRGDGYIDVVISILVAMMMIVLILNIFSFMTLKQDMDYFAKEMINCASANGTTSGKVSARYYELMTETGIAPSVTWSTTYFNASQQTVQLGDTIQLTLTLQSSVRGFGRINIPVTLTAKHSGISQKYWK